MEQEPSYDDLKNKIASLEQELSDYKILVANLKNKNHNSQIKTKIVSEVFNTEDNFRKLTENSVVGIYVISDGKFVYINNSFAKIMGYKKEEIIEKLSPNDIIHPDDIGIVQQRLKQRLQGQMEQQNYIYKAIRKDKSQIFIEVYGGLIEYQGKPSIMGSLIDVTEREFAKIDLSKSEERFKLFMKHMPGVAFIKDPQGKYTYINQHFCDLVKKERTSVIGSTNEDIFPLKIAEQLTKNDQQVRITKQPFTIEEEGTLDGNYLRYVSAKFPYPFKDGLGVAGLAINITEIYQTRKEKEVLEKRLNQAQKLEAIGTLASGIAHDFNNILSAVLGFSDIARMEIEDKNSTAAECIEQVHLAGLRAKDLVDHILTFSSKADNTNQFFHFIPIITEAVKFLKASLSSAIEIQFTHADCNDLIYGDSSQIHRLLINLCVNAAHSMEQGGGTIKLHLGSMSEPEIQHQLNNSSADNNMLQFTISDTGVGIPVDILNRIFDPFFTTKKRSEGTGMGLSIVHGIVKEMGGMISVESEVGVGSCFSIQLPVYTRIDNQENSNNQFANTQKLSGRILFVDDEEALCKVADYYLSKLGYGVTTHTNPMDALESFRNVQDNDSYELVITDYDMPSMNGVEFSKQLLKIKPNTPILLYTGFACGVTLSQIKEVGIHSLMKKPVILPELAKQIKTILKEHKNGRK